MTRIINLRQQRGFTLIEALFSSLILGIALLALAGFQAVALQDGSLVKARAVASNLAQEKLDDLRSFTRVLDDTSLDEDGDGNLTNDCGAGTFCFSEIAANAGGKETTGGALELPSGSVAGYNDSYSRSWTVTCSATPAINALSFSSTCNASTLAKLVTVTIAWTDSKGTPQSVVLQSVIYAMDPSKAARAALSPVSPESPAVPQSVSPGDPPVATDVEGDKFRVSSKPLPDVSSKGYSLRTEFDTVDFNNASGSPTKDSQLQFATVNCVCEFAGSGQGYPASYFYWDGTSLQIKVPSSTVTKMTGSAPSIQGDQQDSLCDSCCRDHHDSEAPGTSDPTTALYDPDRPATDYTGSNHKHYYYVNPNDPTQGLVAVSESTGNRYLEACRFVRVSGIFRILQDWRALDVVVMPPFNDYLGVDDTLTAYQTYLKNFLKYQTYADCIDAGATGCNAITQTSAPSKSEMVTRDLSSLTPGTTGQLLARALYSDRVYGKTAPRTPDASYYASQASKIGSDATWLDQYPFNEVNVTLLANWASSDTSVVTVTNEAIADISANTADYYGVYSRGLAQVQAGNGGSANVSAYLLPSNSGLTGGVKRSPYANVVDYDSSLAASGTIGYAGPIGIDPDDHRSGNRRSNYLSIGRAVSYSSTTVSGDIRIGNADASFVTSTGVTLTASPSSGISCTVANPVSGVASYSCTTNTSYSGTLTITAAQTNAFFDVGGDTTYDSESTTMGYSGSSANVPENVCNITSGVMNSSCKNYWLFGPTAEIRGKCNGTQCGTSTFASKLGGSGADVACTLSGTDVICPVTLDSTTKTWTGVIKITGNGTSYVSASSTCSASDGAGSKTTGSVTGGPADKQSAFDVCATTGSVAPSAPIPGWTGVNPQTLSWSAVGGATGYKVYTCSTSNNNSLTACSPSTLAPSQPQVGTTYNPGVPSSKGTICVGIKSTDGTLDSAMSSTKCIYFKNPSTYNYQ